MRFADAALPGGPLQLSGVRLSAQALAWPAAEAPVPALPAAATVVDLGSAAAPGVIAAPPGKPYSAPVGGSGAAVATTAPDDFPALPGIDRERAIQRLGKDRAMFLGLLEMFIEDNAGVVTQTRADLAGGDTDAAARRMHTLRSNAGFICALELMEAAGALEKAIEHGEPGDPGVGAGLDAIEARIAAIVEAARALA